MQMIVHRLTCGKAACSAAAYAASCDLSSPCLLGLLWLVCPLPTSELPSKTLVSRVHSMCMHEEEHVNQEADMLTHFDPSQQALCSSRMQCTVYCCRHCMLRVD